MHPGQAPKGRTRTRQATPPPAFLFHSQCQTSADNWPFGRLIRRIRPGPKAAPFAKRRGYRPRPFPGQPPISAKSTGCFTPEIWPKTIHLRTQGWIRKAIAAVGRKGRVYPRLPLVASAVFDEIREKGVLPQPLSSKARAGRCGARSGLDIGANCGDFSGRFCNPPLHQVAD